MSLEATRELAEVLGVDALALLRANRDRPWTVEAGTLAFESLRAGDVLRHPRGGEIVLMGGGPTDFQQLVTDPQFASAWNTIQTQLKSEGASTLETLAAQTDLANAFTSVVSGASGFGVDAATALASAKDYVLAGRTVAGAVNTVQRMQAAAAGGDPAQAFQIFTGTLVGAATAAGAVSAGVGALIVAGVGVALQALESAGMFGSPPQGTQWCPNLYANPAPVLQVGCVASHNATQVALGSAYWRRFPKKTGGNPNDGLWYTNAGQYTLGSFGLNTVSWAGSPAGPAADWTSYGGYRLIDSAFPEWHYLACQTVPAGLEAFSDAFTQAWIANKEFALNGLKVQPDWQVFGHLVRIWNRAHEGSTFVDLAPTAYVPLVEPYFTWDGFKATLVGSCSSVPPLFQTTITELFAKSSSSDLSGLLAPDGGHVRIYTGAQIVPEHTITLHLHGQTLTPSEGLSSGEKVAVGVGAAAAAGTGLWLALGKPLTIQALQSAFGRLLERL